MNKQKIVIIGYGWIGQANALALSHFGYKVSFFDINSDVPHHYANTYASEYAKVSYLPDPRAVDSEDTVYMVCVGDKVSDDGEQDISLIKGALTSLEGVQGTVVLRSTIVPDLLRELTFDYYLPEFLHEKKAVEECINPYLFVVGKNTDKKEPEFFATWRKLAHKVFDGLPEDSAHIKYISNLWNSVRIAFVNEIGDAITHPDSPDEIGRAHV